MRRSIPAWISRVAILAGLALFGVTLLYVDRDETLRESRRLGLLLPVVLLPSGVWHALRTLGWYWCFPTEVRPSYGRLFRIRLAADAVSYFTIRGLASEPLRVVLLLDRVPPAASTASTILERTAMGVISVVLVAVTALAAMTSDVVPDGWQRIFRGIAAVAVAVVILTAIFLTRRGRYIGPLLEGMYRRTGWGWTEGRVARFIRDVEAIFLQLARSDRTRLAKLAALAIACYAVMAFEVWVVFWAIGQPISVWSSMIVETFTRSASVAGALIPANLGALEASNVAVVRALGLAGGGSLALARRVRGMLWAGLGLLFYPRDTLRTQPRAER
ncbi:MAG TPA: lysylphosphatidylglycerol synthase domain-containing protein [Vicinamibacterales bacterium]|nr:lysylphosphatidylglycerol synthase domain-containing protein [Vicinamibacterales bacterium]